MCANKPILHMYSNKRVGCTPTNIQKHYDRKNMFKSQRIPLLQSQHVDDI